MNRTQIQLTEEQHKQLRDLSKETGEPIASLIRKSVDQFLMTRTPDRKYFYRQAGAVIGKYEAGIPDVSVNHDKYLEEAFEK